MAERFCMHGCDTNYASVKRKNKNGKFDAENIGGGVNCNYKINW